jgi:hypothetical protein
MLTGKSSHSCELLESTWERYGHQLKTGLVRLPKTTFSALIKFDLVNASSLSVFKTKHRQD